MMSLEKSTPEELMIEFKEKYQSIVSENQKLSQKIKENEAVALKLLGAIETLQYLEKDEDSDEDSLPVDNLDS